MRIQEVDCSRDKLRELKMRLQQALLHPVRRRRRNKTDK
jgi:hypothetical protein